ncbi:MAG TPA: O-antigen ligase family protein [Acidimicrobiales bacterium]|nr:O-antigen ligase family protein [Acidimicrobiales bacterium]
MQVLRAPTSVAFLLAVGVAVVGVAVATRRLARSDDLWGTARRAVLLALLVLMPAAFDPRTVDVFNIAKYSIVVVGAFAFVVLWTLQAAHSRVVPNWRNGLHWPVIALLCWTAVTTATSLNPRLSLLGSYQSYDGFFTALALTLVFFAAAEAFPVADLKTVLSVLYFGGGGLTVLYGFFQLHDRTWGGRWDWVDWGRSLSFATGTSIWSSFGNPNHLAGFFAIILPIGMVLLILHRRWWVRAVILVIAAVLVLELLQTTTRGAWLAALAALATLAVLMFPEIRHRPRITLSVMAGVLVVVLSAALVLGSAQEIASQFRSIIDFDAGTTASQRTTFWKAAVRMANDHPVVGTGPEGFESLYPSYQPVPTNGPHNVFMNYLATQGYPGLLLFLAVLTLASIRVIGALRRLRSLERDAGDGGREQAREARLALTAVAAGLVAYLVQGSFDIQQIGLSFAFWVLLALSCVVVRAAMAPDTFRGPQIHRQHGSRGAKKTPARPAPARSRLVTGAMVVTAAFSVVAFASVATRPYRADHHYWSALRDNGVARSLGPADSGKAERLIDRSGEKMERAISLNPWQPRYVGVLAGAKFDLALQLPPRSPQQLTTLDQAWARYRRAVELAPRDAQLLQNYAKVLLAIDQLDPRQAATGAARAAAVSVLRRAVRVRPFDPALRAQLNRVLAESS